MTLRTITYDDAEWQVVPKKPVAGQVAAGMLHTMSALCEDEMVGRGRAIAAYMDMLAAAPEPPDMDAEWLDHMPNEDERKWEQIEAWARASYRRHMSAARGQMMTRADAYEHHVACAALKWARENPEPPAQEINQCDGCRRGLPVNEHGIHRCAGYDLMACTAHLYQAPAQQPMTDEQIMSACYTYRHDFGLLPHIEQHLLMTEARRWADAFGIKVEQ